MSKANWIVLAKRQETLTRLPAFVKFSTDRAPEFQVMTRIDRFGEDKRIFKIPQTKDAARHIDRMVRNSGRLDEICRPNGFTVNRCKKTVSGAEMEYLDGPTLLDRAYEKIRSKEPTSVLEAFEPLIRLIVSCATDPFVQTGESEEIFGAQQLPEGLRSAPLSNIDLLPENIMAGQDNFIIIDCEWTFDFPVPALFVLYRCFFYSLLRVDDLTQSEQQSMLSDLCERLGIPAPLRQTFENMESHFQQWVMKDARPLWQTRIRPYFSGGAVHIPKESGRDSRLDGMNLDDLLEAASASYAMRDSTSWPITRPIRRLKCAVTGEQFSG